MTYQGTVQNGMIQIDGGVCLPEGAKVQIEFREEPRPWEEPSGKLTIGQKLAALARKFESLPCDLPEDLAENHDHYLYGLPKRR
jgi:hypothetical protein